jgi:ATP-dependent Zn protease
MYIGRTSTKRSLSVLFWMLVMVSLLLFWLVIRTNSTGTRIPEIDFSTFMSQAEAGQIARVRITGTRIDGEYRTGNGKFWLTGPSNPAVFLGVLQDKGVEIRFRDVQTQNIPLQLLGTWAPLFLLVILWIIAIRRLGRRGAKQSAGGNLDPSNQQPLTPQ